MRKPTPCGAFLDPVRPFVRAPTGFDTFDLTLDLIVGPNFESELKDEDEFATFLDAGVISPEEEQAVRRAQDEVLERVSKRSFPFDGAWLDRSPLDCSPIRTLPEGWDVIDRG